MHHHDRKNIKVKGLESNLLHEHSSTWKDVLGFKKTYSVMLET